MWYALHVRPRFEYLVAFRLQQRGVEHYFPLRLITRQSANGQRSIEVPLFPGFVFCKAHPTVHRSLLTIPGILDVVRGSATDAAVSEQSIENLKRIINTGLAVQPWPFTSSGKRVTVGNGPLKGVSGILDDSAPARVVFIVSIDSIRRSLAIEVDHHLTFSSPAGVGTAA